MRPLVGGLTKGVKFRFDRPPEATEMIEFTEFCRRVQEFHTQLLCMIERRIHPAVRARFGPEDVLAAITLKCPRNVHQLLQLSPQRFLKWLQKVAHYRLIEQQRFHLDAAWRDPRLEIRDSRQYPVSRDPLLHTPARGRGPAEEVEDFEDRCRIRNSLAELPPGDQLILRLRYINDMDPREVANVMGISLVACNKRDLRARSRLRRLLESPACL